MTDKEQRVEFRMRWEEATDLPSVYANQVYITHAGGEFYVIFGEVELPIMLSLAPDELKGPRDLVVKPVAKLVFTPSAMAAVVKAMAENVRKYEQRQEKSAGEARIQ